MTGPRVWLIGENNPYGNDPKMAMYPMPDHSAGGRLCLKILGMRRRDYISAFERRNLLQAPKWSAPKARAASVEMRKEIGDDPVILLGRRVFDAWFHRVVAAKLTTWAPFSPVYSQRDIELERGPTMLTLPHPSGLSRAWNEPHAVQRTREAVVKLAPHLSKCVGLMDRTAKDGGA